MKRFNLRRIFLLMSTAGVLSISSNAMASAFQLWEQDAASIGNYHAGAAASADDASTGWYNPAGMLRIKNQQLILGADGILTAFKFKGDIAVNTLAGTPAQGVVAQGGNYNTVPFGHYVAPIIPDRLVFGLSVAVPFGLRTDYGNSVPVAYSATMTELQVVDYTPSLAVAITDKFSVGAGFDIQRLSAEFDNVDTLGIAGLLAPQDTNSQNKAHDVGYGYRLGALYQFTPNTRVGVDYRSKVTHHARGNSYFTGPLANGGLGGVQASGSFHANATLPPITTLSVFHTFNPCWDIMSSLTYVQWSSFKDLVLQNVAGVTAALAPTNALVVDVGEHYHNSWNYSIGANYHPSDRWILRSGIGYDQTPTNNNYRNLQLPDSDRIALGLGAHFQAWKPVGFDLGWTHIFSMNTRVNSVTQAYGPEHVTTNGSTSGSADVYGLQVKWDIT